jgi:hypothetical protein
MHDIAAGWHFIVAIFYDSGSHDRHVADAADRWLIVTTGATCAVVAWAEPISRVFDSKEFIAPQVKDLYLIFCQL